MKTLGNLIYIVLLFVVCNLSGEDVAPASKPEALPVWTFNGHVYKLYNEFATWNMAKNRCEALGGNLVSIKSPEENSFIFNKIKDISGIVYIGASDIEREGSWVWTDGSDVSFNKWPGGQPEVYHGNSHYAAFNPAKSGAYWILPDRTDATYGYICKWENAELYKKAVQAISEETPVAKESAAIFKEEPAPVVKKEPATVVNPKPATVADPEPEPSTTSKFSDLKKKNFMYEKNALVKLEEQLDYIEMSFWKATVLSKTDSFSMDMERKLFTLVSTARLIQQTLIMEKKTEGLNVPRGAIKLSEVWRNFSGRDNYHHGTIRCMSRRSYKLYLKEGKDAYLDWLHTTTVYNIGQFAYRDDKTLQAKISDYFLAVEALRRDIVAVSELELFKENTNLEAPVKFRIKNSSSNPYFGPSKKDNTLK